MPLDPLSDPGFQHFYNLEYDEALAEFQAQAARDPMTPDRYNHIAQTLLFRHMFRSGVLESGLISTNSVLHRPKIEMSAADQRLFADAIARGMDLANARLRSNPNDVAALYSLGVSYGNRANYNFLKKSWMDALSDSSVARKTHAKITAIDGELVDARLILGVHEYVVGSLSWGWRTVGAVAGFKGDRERGIQTLQMVAQKGSANRYDAEGLLAAVLRREDRSREAIPLINDLIQRFPRNFLLRFELAELYGDLDDKTNALAAIDAIEQLKHSNAPGYQRVTAAQIRLARAEQLFGFRDYDRALTECKAAAEAGELHPVMAAKAWLRVGQIHDLKKQRNEAIAAYRQAVRAAPESEAAGESKNYLAFRYKG
jgi:tetratricopeptide (TPR) repeat protein